MVAIPDPLVRIVLKSYGQHLSDYIRTSSDDEVAQSLINRRAKQFDVLEDPLPLSVNSLVTVDVGGMCPNSDCLVSPIASENNEDLERKISAELGFAVRTSEMMAAFVSRRFF